MGLQHTVQRGKSGYVGLSLPESPIISLNCSARDKSQGPSGVACKVLSPVLAKGLDGADYPLNTVLKRNF